MTNLVHTSAGNGDERVPLPTLPGFKRIAIPPEYQDHPFLHEGIFCTLPVELLAELQKELGADAFDGDLFEMEHDLASVSGNHTQFVGFWRKQPINYRQLKWLSLMGLEIGEDLLTQWGLNTVQFENRMQLGEGRLRRFFDVAQGYAGWLMTNPIFREEHDCLLHRFHLQVQEWGLPALGIAATGPIPREMQMDASLSLKEYCDALEAFYLRWRLSGLAAPYLPVPLSPQTPVPNPILATGPMHQVGGLFYLPDTFPVPSRDELRGILEDGLRGSQRPEHILGWTRLVASKNPAKNQIGRYGRVFQIQHFCRALGQRHAGAIRGRLHSLEQALATFLKTNFATIHRDLQLIRSKLGPDWMFQPGGARAARGPRQRRPR